jgi:Flp pilus assembly pilin Flp
MHHLMTQLWKDDRGVMEAIEFLLTASILAFGLVVGLTALRNAITAEFEQLGNAVLALNFSFSAGGLSGCCASVSGSQAIQTPAVTLTGHVCTPPIPTIITVAACP